MEINLYIQSDLTKKEFITSLIDKSMQYYTAFELVFDVTAYNDQHYKNLGITFPEKITTAVIKRKAEFLAGRYAARQCFEKLQVVKKSLACLPFGEDFNLQIGKHRSPLWPQGFIGSITHTNSRACALVVSADNYQGVGIDIENWIPHNTYEQISSLILVGNDGSLFKSKASNTDEISHQNLLTLIFSAKESLFKALYPSVGHYFDFKDAEVIQVDYKQQCLLLRLLKSLGKKPWLQKYTEHKVHFLLGDDYVYTCVLVNDPQREYRTP